jgi:hypothetical protein
MILTTLVAHRAGFAWNQSTDPRLVALRHLVDTRLRPPVCTISHAGPEGPSVGYTGVFHGTRQILDQLEGLRDLSGIPTAGTDELVMRRADLWSGWVPPADLVAVGCSPAQARRLPGRSALLLPYRLHLVVDLRDGWLDAVTKGERQWIRTRRRERDWRLCIATDDASFEHFYDRMHLPTMQVRHGRRTRSESRERARHCLFRTGVLAFAVVDGERVAGALCHRSRHGTTITLRLVGVLDGAREHYDAGALKILYHLLFGWAHASGIRHVDLGGMEAWISRGTFRWKRRFSPRLVLAPNHLGRLRVWWHARRDTPAVRDFLVANPVFEVVGDTGLRAVYFHDDERPARHDLGFSCVNVQQVRTIHLDEFLPREALLNADSCAD